MGIAIKGVKERQRVRLSAEDRRLQIVRAAIELFSRKGFEGTTTKEIAMASGINEAIIFRHFTTKEELYSAIVDHKMNECRLQMRAALDEASAKKDDQAFFTRLAYDMLESYTEDATFMRLMLFSGLAGHQLSRMAYETHVLDMFNHLSRYISERIKDKAYRAVNARAAARAFLSIVAHHALVRELFDKEERVLKLSNKEAASEFADIFLNGVLRRKE